MKTLKESLQQSINEYKMPKSDKLDYSDMSIADFRECLITLREILGKDESAKPGDDRDYAKTVKNLGKLYDEVRTEVKVGLHIEDHVLELVEDDRVYKKLTHYCDKCQKIYDALDAEVKDLLKIKDPYKNDKVEEVSAAIQQIDDDICEIENLFAGIQSMALHLSETTGDDNLWFE